MREKRAGANAFDTTYTYDPVGNRLVMRKDGALTSYTYDAANHLVSSKDVSGTTAYTFDAAGKQRLRSRPPARLPPTPGTMRID